MKKYIVILATLFLTVTTFAQKITLPSFLKWHTNNAPDCKNVLLTKDSILLPVKNKCLIEGVLENWRPSVDISDGLHFSVPANSKIQITITYKFIPQGNDVFLFGGSFDPVSDNSDEAGSRYLQLPDGEDKILPPSNTFTKAIILVNFSNEISSPVFTSKTALKGDMNFNFGITYNAVKGETATHQGSKAVIKEVKLELIQ